MQTSNEYLSAILTVVGRIEQNQKRKESKEKSSGGGSDGSLASKLSSALLGFTGVKKKGMNNFFYFMDEMLIRSQKSKDKDIKKMQVISDSINSIGRNLPNLAVGLGALGQIRPKKVERAIYSLQLLYDFMADAGSPRKARRVDRAVKTFEKIGRGLNKIARPIKDITMGFAYLGLGILAFAGSMLLTSMILKLSKPSDVLLFLGATIIGVALMFGILALARKTVDRGTDVIRDIGFGMVALSLGILSFALTIRLLPSILGSESGGSIAKSMLLMVGIVGASVLMFAIIGAFAPLIKQGTGVVFLMSVGLMVLSVAIVGLAIAAKYLAGGSLSVGAKDVAASEKDENKKTIMRGLGTLGVIVLASIALFALLGIPVVAGLVALGSATAILLSVSLIMLAKSVSKLVGVAKELQGEDIAGNISFLIKGAINGFLGGISSLSGGKKGVAGIKEFLKNSAKVFAGVGVLMSMSVALSMFAKAISAFAELENMRVIKGHDSNGSPIFGEKVNVRDVAKNINFSISTFLESLLSSTTGLTRDKSKALKKMGRALTGRRGILSAVIAFSDVLKTYAEFGPDGKIGFIDMIPDGTDEDGNAKFKQVPKTVKITTVVKNIVDSFSAFVADLTSKAEVFKMDRRDGRKMQILAKTLLGKKGRKGKEKYGLLQPINAFSETLGIYAKYGDNLMIPQFDAEGNENGKPISVKKIANNVVKTLSTFVTEIANSSLATETDSMKKAKKNLSRFDDIIERVSKISTSLDGMSRFNLSIKELASNIGLLVTNLAELDANKLGQLSNMSAAYLAKTNDYSVSNRRIQEGANQPVYMASEGGSTKTIEKYTTSAGTSGTAQKLKETDWDRVAAQIGEAVGGQIVGALKSGQMKFEFSSTANNKGVLEFG